MIYNIYNICLYFWKIRGYLKMTFYQKKTFAVQLVNILNYLAQIACNLFVSL